MRSSTSKSRGFVTITVLALTTLLIIITSAVFETSHAVLTSYKVQRASSSAAFAGLHAFKRTSLKRVKEFREVFGDLIEFPPLKKNEILGESAREAESAAILTARKIAGGDARVTAHYTGRTMQVIVRLPYRPLFLPIPVQEFSRESVMSFKKNK